MIYEDISLDKFLDNDENLNAQDIFKFFIEFLSDKLLSQFKLYKLIFILVMTTKGLTCEEIIDIVNLYFLLNLYIPSQADITKEKWEIFESVFKNFIIEFNGNHMIINKEIKSAILDLNEKDNLINLSSLHFDIA